MIKIRNYEFGMRNDYPSDCCAATSPDKGRQIPLPCVHPHLARGTKELRCRNE